MSLHFAHYVSADDQKKKKKLINLLLLSSNQVFPFMDWLSQVYAVHGDLDLADDVVFTKAVEVEYLQHQSLSTQLTVWDLERYGEY